MQQSDVALDFVFGVNRAVSRTECQSIRHFRMCARLGCMADGTRDRGVPAHLHKHIAYLCVCERVTRRAT